MSELYPLGSHEEGPSPEIFGLDLTVPADQALWEQTAPTGEQPVTLENPEDKIFSK